MLGRDGSAVAELMMEFRAEGRVRIAPDRLGWLSEHHDAGELSDEECVEEIGRAYRESGYLMDPHTAIGVGVARRLRRRDHVPMVCLGTAHPAKFPDAVEQATGVRPALPAHLADEIAAEATEMTVFEDFVQEKVMEGRSILGLYPPTDEKSRTDFAEWRKAQGR
jgi:threonine synthase